jgi:hypothetical protein
MKPKNCLIIFSEDGFILTVQYKGQLSIKKTFPYSYNNIENLKLNLEEICISLGIDVLDFSAIKYLGRFINSLGGYSLSGLCAKHINKSYEIPITLPENIISYEWIYYTNMKNKIDDTSYLLFTQLESLYSFTHNKFLYN